MPELGAQQVADGDQVGVGAIALGAGLGGLDLGVEGLDLAVGQAGVEMPQDAREVVAEGGAELLEGRQPTPSCPRDPLSEQRFGGGAIRCRLVDAAQRLLEAPGAGGLQRAALQPMHGVNLRCVPPARGLERAPAAVLELRVGLDLGPPHLIQRLVGQRHDVEGVEADGGLRCGRLRPGLIGAGQVHAPVRDLAGLAPVRPEVVCEPREGGLVAARCGKQQPAPVEIMKQRDVALAFAAGGLVDTDAPDLGEVLLRPRGIDMPAQDAPDTVIRDADEPRHMGHGQRSAHGDDKGFHQHRKAGALGRPRHRCLRGLAARAAGHARHAAMDERLELEEVQVLPGALHPVVHRLVRRPTGRTGQARGIARHLEVDRPLIRTKRHAVHRPRRRQPQSLGEELFLHPTRLTSSGAPFHTRRDGAEKYWRMD